MEYVRLGSSGLKVSRLALGMMSYGSPRWRDWVLDEEASRPLVRRAVELGFNFFDTANLYSRGESERVTGKLLREFFGGRDEFVVATKVCLPMGERPNQRGLSRKHILDSIDASLQRLGLEYVDLYQIHRWDPETPIEETMEALHDVVRAGKARYLGASSMWTWQFAKAQYTASSNGWTRFVSMQNHYNLITREEEREMIPFCLDQGVGILPWSPLARGFLAGNRTPDRSGETPRSRSDAIAHRLYYSEADWATLRVLEEGSQKRGVTMAQLALAWLLHKPGVTSPIIGVTRDGQLEELVEALAIELDAEEIEALEAPYVPKLPPELHKRL
ncbi:MAG: aldo/keto reductase [Acidobacteriota bacterium]